MLSWLRILMLMVAECEECVGVMANIELHL